MRGQPKTQYAELEGSRIAYQVFGSGPVDFVYCAGLTSNCDHIWDVPDTAALLRRAGDLFRVILFDRRGSGHSDPTPDGVLPTWESWSDDILAVLDAVVSPKAVIYGERDGGMMALLFAAMHPERVQALGLGNASACFLAADDYPCGIDASRAEGWVRLFGEKWGSEELTMMLLPDLRGDEEALRLQTRAFRGAASPRQAADHFRYMFDLDARSALGAIRVPTVVFHRRDFPLIPVSHGRYLAERIEGAALFEMDGAQGSVLFASHAERILETILEAATGKATVPDQSRTLATVLFCDIVGSTELAAAMQDESWHELLEKFHWVVRRELVRFGGQEIDTAGDGFLISFDRPSRAMDCARSLLELVPELGLSLRVGIHTGECTRSQKRLTGLAVHVGARIAAAASPGECWVSETVKALALGSRADFSSRGVHALKGAPGDWELFAVA